MLGLEAEMNELKKSLVEYGSLVIRMTEKSIEGLTEKKDQLLIDIIEGDEPKANDLEIEIDERCITLIVRYQPRAKDLRLILMILQMNNDLERIADHAVNISKNGLCLIEEPLVKPLIDIPRMAMETIGMFHDSIKAFLNEDPKLAKSVCERDTIVDGLRDQILRELVTYMISDSTTIERSLRLISISNNLERIADLTTNFCEDVIFISEGKVIKHHKEEEKDE